MKRTQWKPAWGRVAWFLPLIAYYFWGAYRDGNFTSTLKMAVYIIPFTVLCLAPLILVQAFDIKIGKSKPKFVEGGGIWWAIILVPWIVLSLLTGLIIFGDADSEFLKVLAYWLGVGMFLPLNLYMVYIYTRYKRVVQYQTAEWANTPYKKRDGYIVGKKVAFWVLGILIAPIIFIVYAGAVVEPTFNNSDKCLWPGKVIVSDASERPDKLICDLPPHSLN